VLEVTAPPRETSGTTPPKANHPEKKRLLETVSESGRTGNTWQNLRERSNFRIIKYFSVH
jgi:hypothetical protein